MKKYWFALGILCSFCLAVGAQSPKIEYIAHAAFVIESSQGTRVVIDPYHSYKQMGFTFPENILADFVLITHPHYDHDGSQYFSKNTAVFRDSGTYQYKDIAFYGIASNHSFAEQIGKSGNQNYNTIWVVEIDGIKIAHLGDNEVPTAAEVLQLADVDYIIGHPRDADLQLFKDKVYIPNHYLLPEVTKHTNWMKPVNTWLENKEDVKQLSSNVYTPSSKDQTAQILVFKPSPLVQEWSQDYYDALEAIAEGYKVYKESEDIPEAILFMDKAISLAPFVMDGYYAKAVMISRLPEAYVTGGESMTVAHVLEQGFNRVPDVDWGAEAQARVLLARYYVSVDSDKLAFNQYLWLQRHDRIVNKRVIKEAQEYIVKFGARD